MVATISGWGLTVKVQDLGLELGESDSGDKVKCSSGAMNV